MGFAALGLFAIPKMEPALQSPMPSVGIFTAFGEGLPDGAGVLVPASDLLVVNTLAEKPLESLGGGLVALGAAAYAYWRHQPRDIVPVPPDP